MAKLIRSAKSGSEWTLNELQSYNIHLKHQEALEFFGVPVLPDPAVDPELLQHLEANDMKQEHNARFVKLLDMAMLRSSGESAVDDFAIELLKFLGYDCHNRVAATRRDLPLFICGESKHAKPDVCIIEPKLEQIKILLVQEDKRLNVKDPLSVCAQLVAEALAAFTKNNTSRLSFDLPPLELQVIPGIIMVGTAPMFFKIPVTQELMDHVRQGTYPQIPTIVTYCCPPLLSATHSSSDGMKPLSNRRQVLSYYEAFKTVVGI